MLLIFGLKTFYLNFGTKIEYCKIQVCKGYGFITTFIHNKGWKEIIVVYLESINSLPSLDKLARPQSKGLSPMDKKIS